MKKQNLLLVVFLVSGLSTIAVQAQDASKNKNLLNTAFEKQSQSQPQAPLNDPGPVWQGLTDTTAFGDRMEHHLQSAEEAVKELLAVSQSRTVANTAMPYLTARDHLKNADRIARLALDAHPDSSYRTFAQVWGSIIAEKRGAFDTNPKIYRAIKTIDLTKADSALRYVIEMEIQDYERNGVALSDDKRKQMAELRSKINTFGTRFERNIFTATPTLQLHKDSLDGIPQDWIEKHPANKSGYVTFQMTPPEFQLVSNSADIESTRLTVIKAFFSKAYPKNLAVLDSLRTARHELAQLLGYQSWAHYAIEPMMAGSPERVRRFLTTIDSMSAEVIEDTHQQLLEIKQAEQPDAEMIKVQDRSYLTNKLKQRKYNFDTQTMREHLPYERVRDGIFATFEQMFAIDIRPAPKIPVWYKDVEPYEVWEQDRLIGRFYLDMHPRKGKFGHAAVFDLRMGNHSIPEASLIVNFPSPKDNDPALLSPGQMTTFFHEFGHLLHVIFGGNQHIMGEIEQDFIESPSQLLEEWAQDPEVLSKVARHYKTGKPIPKVLVENYRRSQWLNRIIRARQLYLPALSLALFDRNPQDNPPVEIENRILKDYFPYELKDWIHIATVLPHLNPYSSNYYNYLWAEVIGRDLLTGFNQDDLLDPEVGRRYRETILARSGTTPIDELIEEFLGRPFNAEAWQKWINGDKSEMANTNNTER